MPSGIGSETRGGVPESLVATRTLTVVSGEGLRKRAPRLDIPAGRVRVRGRAFLAGERRIALRGVSHAGFRPDGRGEPLDSIQLRSSSVDTVEPLAAEPEGRMTVSHA